MNGFKVRQPLPRPFARTASGLVLAVIIGLIPGCEKSQEDMVRDAIQSAFPDGGRRCIGLSNELVGVHVTPPPGGIIWYPSDGPTSPIRHMFAFYAAPENAPAPELVTEMTKAGVLRKEVVVATTDVASQRLGPQSVSSAGWATHPTLYSHDVRTLKVAIYETAPASSDFRYDIKEPISYGGVRFPSRIDSTPLPPADTQYTVPLTEPYAVSLATAVCLKETLNKVVSAERKTLWTGDPYVEAVVTFRQEPAAWMRTPAFTKDAMQPNTPSLTADRRAIVLLRPEGEKLLYVREDRR